MHHPAWLLATVLAAATIGAASGDQIRWLLKCEDVSGDVSACFSSTSGASDTTGGFSLSNIGMLIPGNAEVVTTTTPTPVDPADVAAAQAADAAAAAAAAQATACMALIPTDPTSNLVCSILGDNEACCTCENAALPQLGTALGATFDSNCTITTVTKQVANQGDTTFTGAVGSTTGGACLSCCLTETSTDSNGLQTSVCTKRMCGGSCQSFAFANDTCTDWSTNHTCGTDDWALISPLPTTDCASTTCTEAECCEYDGTADSSPMTTTSTTTTSSTTEQDCSQCCTSYTGATTSSDGTESDVLICTHHMCDGVCTKDPVTFLPAIDTNTTATCEPDTTHLTMVTLVLVLIITYYFTATIYFASTHEKPVQIAME